MSRQFPVHVMKNGCVAGVIMSAARFAELETLDQEKSMTQSKREFNETYKDWIEVQNGLVEKIGVFGEDLRPW